MKNILLIGVGRFGRHIAMHLNQLGHQVMAVDTDENRINDVMNIVTNAQIGDSTNAEFLKSLGVGNFDVCMVTIGDSFQNSLETTSLLKELGARYVVSRAERDVQEKFLLRNGADAVVYPEKHEAKWAAVRYTADHILDLIQLDNTHAILEVEVPESWLGKSIIELDIRKKYGVNIMAIKHNDSINVNVEPDIVLTEDITLLVLGDYKNLKKGLRLGGMSMKTGLIIIILIVVILLFMAAGWYVMNKIDGFMNRTRRTNDKDTMNAVLNESDDNEKKRY